MKTQLRQSFILIHRWVGALVGLVFCIIGLTGTVIVFHHELNDNFVHPEFVSVIPQGERVRMESILPMVQAVHPDFKLDYFYPGHLDTDPYSVGVYKEEGDRWIQVYVNPYTSQIMGESEWGKSWLDFLYKLHYQLAAGTFGDYVIKIAGLALIAVAISGLIIWPSWRKIPEGLKIRWNSPWRLINYDFHKVIGIIGSLFLLVLAITGSFMMFWSQFEWAAYALTGTPKPAELKSIAPTEGAQRLSLDELVLKGNSVSPDRFVDYMTIPAVDDTEAVVEAGLAAKDRPHEWSGESVKLNQYTGEILQVSKPEDSAASFLMYIYWPLHVGTWGGILTRILYSLIGLTPTILFVTGLGIWWRKTHGVKRKGNQIDLPLIDTTIQ